MVEGQPVVVNVMLPRYETAPCLVHPIGAQGGEVMYFVSFCFRGELGYLNCDEL